MNVFLYSEDKLLLLAIADAVRKAGETPFIATDFQTLQSNVTKADPDIAFVDEALFPPEKILKLQQHIFNVLLDFPVASIKNPFITTYRGKIAEQTFNKIARIVSEAACKHEEKNGLSPKLSALLNFMMLHKDEDVRTDTMMSYLWNDCNAAHKKTLHTYICKLREKLTETGSSCALEKVAKSTYSLKTKKAPDAKSHPVLLTERNCFI